MNQSFLARIGTKFKSVPTSVFLILAIIFGIISLGALRANNEHMLRLRTAVYAADKQGSGVQESLQALQLYVTQHMNTKLDSGGNAVYPPVQLKYTYDRLVRSESDLVASQNKDQYNDAVAHCPSGGNSYQQHLSQQDCVVNYMQDKHNVVVPTIPDALYKFDFVSPAWSPDMAGWSIVAAATSAFLFVISFVIRLWLKLTAA